MEKTLARCALKSEVKKARAIFWSSVVKKSAASGAEVDMPLFDDLYDSDDDTDLTKASIEWVRSGMVGSLPRFVSECSERATSESVKAKQYYDHLYNGMANSPAVVRGAVGSQYEYARPSHAASLATFRLDKAPPRTPSTPIPTSDALLSQILVSSSCAAPRRQWADFVAKTNEHHSKPTIFNELGGLLGSESDDSNECDNEKSGSNSGLDKSTRHIRKQICPLSEIPNKYDLVSPPKKRKSRSRKVKSPPISPLKSSTPVTSNPKSSSKRSVAGSSRDIGPNRKAVPAFHIGSLEDVSDGGSAFMANEDVASGASGREPTIPELMKKARALAAKLNKCFDDIEDDRLSNVGALDDALNLIDHKYKKCS